MWFKRWLHQEQLENTRKELVLTTETANTRAVENQNLQAKKSILESDVKQYELALKKVNKRVRSLEKTVDTTSVNIN